MQHLEGNGTPVLYIGCKKVPEKRTFQGHGQTNIRTFKKTYKLQMLEMRSNF
jgi:hypothetical protein